jgi:hypothetical protein
VQGHESLATGDVVEQRLLLRRRDLVDVGVQHQTVELASVSADRATSGSSVYFNSMLRFANAGASSANLPAGR